MRIQPQASRNTASEQTEAMEMSERWGKITNNSKAFEKNVQDNSVKMEIYNEKNAYTLQSFNM